MTVRTIPLKVLAASFSMAFFSMPALAQTQVTSFGSNPGALQMFKHVPSSMPSNAALVVALHGCTQTAADYVKAGWTQLANTHKFYVLYPQQVSGNNANKCFNWFEPGDIARGQGEALSIKQMVDKMKADHSIDANRVFVTGLSAGGAMTNVMLATYPDVFRGGAPIAGIPYKCATTMSAGFGCMSGSNKTPVQWGDLARSGYSGYSGTKPRVSIWQGSSDTTVQPMNMTETMEQWTNYHGADQTSDASATIKGFPRNRYNTSGGTLAVETYSITNMAHGTPVAPGTGTDQCGTAAPYILNVGICSSYFIGEFWGIIGGGGTTTTTTGGTTTTTSGTTTTTVAATCYTSSNYAHTTAGRAYTTGGYVYANGSNQNMGLNNTYATTTLKQTGTNYYVIGTC